MQYVTKSGKVLTDEDIQRLADEAERGYDVNILKERSSRRGDMRLADREGAYQPPRDTTAKPN